MQEALASWLSTPLGNEVLNYTKVGSYVFPLHGIINNGCTCGKKNCKDMGKHPACKNGLKDATTDIKVAAELFKYRHDYNIGIVTGEKSGFWVLDVDSSKGGDDSLHTLQMQHGDLPDTLKSITGNGYHLFFNYPTGVKIRSSVKSLGDGLDTRGEGGYIVAPPSIHANGNIYHFDKTASTNTIDTPQWLIELLNKKKDTPIVKAQPIPHIEWTVDDVEHMLDLLDPSCGYQDWLEIGMALNRGGYPVILWDTWSSKSDKYVSGECSIKWNSFNPNGEITMGTLVQKAQLRGWKPTQRAEHDISNVLPMLNKLKKGQQKKEQGLGFDPLTLPGLIGDTVRWINKHAIYKQPELALLNTLAFAGAVFGRRYASPLNTRTNVYIVATAATASGKDFSRKCITQLANAAGLENIIGANAIRSDSGMLQSLKTNSSQIMMVDEFGLFLQALSNPQSPHYLRAITKTLLGLYSDSNSIYNHGDYADSKLEPIKIVNPNLCIYGTTTEISYVPSLRKSAIESGELNRFIILPGNNDIGYPERNIPQFEIDEQLRLQWEEFSPKNAPDIGTIVNSGVICPAPITVGWGDCDDLQYQLNRRRTDKLREDSQVKNLWGRFFENTVKIAMIFAIARDKINPIIITRDFDYSQSLVECSIRYLSNMADTSMAETAYEGTHHEIVNRIRDTGGSIMRTELLRKFRKIKKRDLDELITGMIEQEIISVNSETDGQGKRRTIYTLISNIAEAV